jgi:hypothetical protein
MFDIICSTVPTRSCAVTSTPPWLEPLPVYHTSTIPMSYVSRPGHPATTRRQECELHRGLPIFCVMDCTVVFTVAFTLKCTMACAWNCTGLHRSLYIFEMYHALYRGQYHDMYVLWSLSWPVRQPVQCTVTYIHRGDHRDLYHEYIHVLYCYNTCTMIYSIVCTWACIINATLPCSRPAP